MAITLEDLRGDSPAICGDFNKIKEEVIRAVGEDQNEVDRLLTQRILMGLYEFYKKKRKQQHLEKLPLEKKKRKSLEFDLHSLSLNWKLKRQRNKPLEKKKRVVRGIIPPKKPLELATKNFGNINKNQEKQEEEEEEEEENSRKTKKQRKNPTEIKQAVPDRPPFLPTSFKGKIMGLQGSDIKLVIQKELTNTDMKASQDRLSIPKGQTRHDFLSREEQVSLEEKEADGIHFKGMEVPLIEPGLQVSTIFLKKWKLGNSCSYMLSKPWIKVAERNQLKSSNTIQLYSFRVDQKLHFALIKLEN